MSWSRETAQIAILCLIGAIGYFVSEREIRRARREKQEREAK